MKWRGRRQSSNIEDRRGGRRMRRSGPLRTGGIRIGKTGGIGIIVVAVVLFALGINPMEVLDGGQLIDRGPVSQQEGGRPSGSTPKDDLGQFVSVVVAETEDVWHDIFQAAGAKYEEPDLVLFADRVRSACGAASSASGPFYCPGDRKMYIDLSFYEELQRRFEAPGDFAQAYVIAHEVGHHVQNLIGVLPRFNKLRQTLSKDEANALSVRVELQADCFAGIWAHYTAQKGLLEQGDLKEALNAAQQIGDDAIQKRMQGYVVPESFNHGTSAQRAMWFERGYKSGRMDQCDTFNS
ncbi:MAG: neutral zinc metallopeptidase [Stappiaceae bacterium]